MCGDHGMGQEFPVDPETKKFRIKAQHISNALCEEGQVEFESGYMTGFEKGYLKGLEEGMKIHHQAKFDGGNMAAIVKKGYYGMGEQVLRQIQSEDT